ncbi:hypothetical protein CVT24_001635, partial [Panaeolus cyanescens]
MFGRFWGGLQVHKWARVHDNSGVDRKALLIYQGEQRRIWHLMATRGESLPDLSVLSEPLLNIARAEAMKKHFLRPPAGRNPDRSQTVTHLAETRDPSRQLVTAQVLRAGLGLARCPLFAPHPKLLPARVFLRAQAPKSYQPAQSAWGDTNTTSSTAVRNRPSTESIRQWPSESTELCGSSRVEPLCATTSNLTGSARALLTANDTDVLDVPLPLTVLKSALERRREIKHVIQGLELGFVVGFPTISSIQLPQNRPSVDTHKSHFLSIVRDELQKGRYIGPAKQADLLNALGPLQSSPISIIPKT